MTNPWLQIPATDYEAHMALPEVAQNQALEVLFASALEKYAPESLAVFGCTTGNGFEHIDTSITKRVVGVDINPEYLAILKNRFATKIPNLHAIEADFTSPDFRIEQVSLIFAGLVFEYVNLQDALLNINRFLAPEGALVVVLQLPSSDSAPVTTTPYKSLERLAPVMRLVSPGEFADACVLAGLREMKTETVPLKKGKAFYVSYCKKEAESVIVGGD